MPKFSPFTSRLTIAAFTFFFSIAGRSAAQAQSTSAPSPAASAAPSSSAASAPAPQQDSLAEAARKAKEKKKTAPAAPKVFTNDNLPTQGRLASVGPTPAGTAADASAAAANPAGGSGAANDEKAWRDKFASLRHKLDQDQTALDVMQRELNEGSVQFYGGDPNAAFQDQRGQQPLGSEHAKKVDQIDAKKKQIDADQQAIDDAEDELRKSGGDPGWAR